MLQIKTFIWDFLAEYQVGHQIKELWGKGGGEGVEDQRDQYGGLSFSQSN